MNPQSNRLSRRSILLASAGAALASGAALGLSKASLAPSASPTSRHFYRAMGGPLELTLDRSATPQAASILRPIRAVERTLSAFDMDSELCRLNLRAACESVGISNTLRDVLRAASSAHQQTEGAFDPTVGPLLEAWGFRSDPAAPSSAALRDARGRVGFQFLSFDDHSLAFTRDRMALDFGGIAVGYAVDLAVREAHARGIHHGLINAAGDIRAIGPRPDGSPWTVGIRDPSDATKALAAVRLDGTRAMTTSGTYEKCRSTAAGRVSHIFDPRTGDSPREVISATVLAPEAATADAMATASIVVGASEALAMLERCRHTEGMLVVATPGGRQIMATTGFEGEILRKA